MYMLLAWGVKWSDHRIWYATRLLKAVFFRVGTICNEKGTEVPNPRRSSACDCTCVLTRIDHCLVNNSIMTFALELI